MDKPKQLQRFKTTALALLVAGLPIAVLAVMLLLVSGSPSPELGLRAEQMLLVEADGSLRMSEPQLEVSLNEAGRELLGAGPQLLRCYDEGGSQIFERRLGPFRSELPLTIKPSTAQFERLNQCQLGQNGLRAEVR